MFCYFQFLKKDPAERLVSHGKSHSIQEHPFFESTDRTAVEDRRMEPPQESQMKEVHGTGSVLISCHKLLFKLNVKWEMTVLKEAQCVV